MSFFENIRNIFSNHWLEFTVKYESNLFIEVVDRSSRDSSTISRKKEKLYEEDDAETRTTVMRIRTSANMFNWTVVDINRVLETQSKEKK